MKKSRVRRALVVLIGVCVGAVCLWFFGIRRRPVAINQFAMDQQNGTINDIPAAVRKLDGRRVTLSGVPILSWDDARNDFQLRPFWLVMENHPPGVTYSVDTAQDVVVCSLSTSARGVGPEQVLYTTALVSGTLHIALRRDETGRNFESAFTMDVDDIEPVWDLPRWVVAAIWTGTGIFVVSVGTLLFARVWRPRRRLAAGLCVRCGYDLRASPVRCPECGLARPGNGQ